MTRDETEAAQIANGVAAQLEVLCGDRHAFVLMVTPLADGPGERAFLSCRSNLVDAARVRTIREYLKARGAL
jgi:hypothetical protein